MSTHHTTFRVMLPSMFSYFGIDCMRKNCLFCAPCLSRLLGEFWTFSNSLRPIEIEQDGSRALTSALSQSEISQFRGAIMKCQWRAVQSPQYSARIGIAASKANRATIQDLREANSLLKEFKKTSKVDMIFPNFNAGRTQPLHWKEMVMLHFGDASHLCRDDGSSTGGYVSAMTTPPILEDVETRIALFDWKSWKVERTSKGSNGAEAQTIYETKDRGWRCRLMWSLLHGLELCRGNAESLASAIKSLECMMPSLLQKILSMECQMQQQE